MMKKNRFARILLLLTLTGAGMLLNCVRAQKIALNGYGSYVLAGGYNAEYGATDYLQGKTKEGMQWGMGVEYIGPGKYGFEAMYLRRATSAFQQSKMDPQKYLNFNLALNYLLFGINGYLQPDNKKLQAYGSLFAGVVIEDINFPGSSLNSSVAKFAWAVRFGGKYWLSDRVGIRLQTQWTSFFVMNGGLPTSDVSGFNTANINYPIAYQFEVGTGFMVKLYRNKTE